MRKIIVPVAALARSAYGPVDGRALVVPVRVDWPELRLTQSQTLENALWRAQPHRTTQVPYPDHSIFDLELPYLDEAIVMEIQKWRRS